MGNSSDLKRVFIFIASPGDVGMVRDLVRHAIERINKLLAKEFGFLFEAIGWEDIPPGKGKRAQEVINKYVDVAHIFLGILNQRFGEPTGIADSGAEEEFLRIEKRWGEESPKPAIWLYFKKIPTELLKAPSTQLTKVLEFKERIKKTIFYQEFDEEYSFEEKFQDTLAAWVHEHRVKDVRSVPEEIPGRLRENDVAILSFIVQKSEISIDQIVAESKKSKEDVAISVKKLAEQNLIEKIGEICKISNSTDSFVLVAKYLLIPIYYRSFMTSSYFLSMIDTRLTAILANRQHCQMNAEELRVLSMLLKISPEAAGFILFGDTTRFDNAINQMHQQKFEGALKSMTEEFISISVKEQIAIKFINDTMSGKDLYNIDGKMLVGTLTKIQLSGAFEDKPAFQILISTPRVLAKAGGEIRAGQIVFGSPEVLMNHGTILCHLGESGLAIDKFDEVLSNKNISDELRAATLNNKGLALLTLQRISKSRRCFKQALKFNPNLNEAKINLDRIRLENRLSFKIKKFLRVNI